MPQDIPAQARHLLRTALKGSLATLDQPAGAPYVSMVAVATSTDGSPLQLISGLARHTANAAADARVGLLLDSTDTSGDPESGARLTLTGDLHRTEDLGARRRYLARQPSAAIYADFADFSFWRLEIGHGHFIGGFGRIQPLDRQQLCLETDISATFAAGEPDMLAQIQRSRPALLRGFSDPWAVTGVDPEGIDLRAGTATARVPFVKRAASIAEALVLLAGPA